MKKGTRKALLALCCAMILVAISVGATLAYLTDSEAVTNTFTVGQVGLTLDEIDVYEDGDDIPEDSKPGEPKPSAAPRVKENKYHLLPGQTYIKDPTVHVDADSEASWIFVKVENGLAEIEIETETDTEKKIATQIADNGWTALGENYPGIYYRAHAAKGAADYMVFSDFTIDGASVTNTILAEYATDTNEDAQIKVTAYAIQMAGFEGEPAEAWAAGNW